MRERNHAAAALGVYAGQPHRPTSVKALVQRYIDLRALTAFGASLAAIPVIYTVVFHFDGDNAWAQSATQPHRTASTAFVTLLWLLSISGGLFLLTPALVHLLDRVLLTTVTRSAAAEFDRYGDLLMPRQQAEEIIDSTYGEARPPRSGAERLDRHLDYLESMDLSTHPHIGVQVERDYRLRAAADADFQALEHPEDLAAWKVSVGAAKDLHRFDRAHATFRGWFDQTADRRGCLEHVRAEWVALNVAENPPKGSTGDSSQRNQRDTQRS